MNPPSYSTLMGDHPAEGGNLFPVNTVYFNPIFTDEYHGILEKTSSFMLEDSTNCNDVFAENHPLICSNDLQYSNFICDDLPVPMGELSCMLSPRLFFPNSSNIGENNLSDDLQFLEGGVNETEQQLIALGDHMICSEEEKTRLGQPEMLKNIAVSDHALTADIARQKEPKEKGARTKRRISTSTTVINKRSKLQVDLRTLLIQCAEAVGANDFRNANDFLMQIRKHSSSSGNASQRKAHYFAKALEARLAGTGSEQYAALASRKVLNANIEACRLLISACPFMKVSNFFAREMIMKVVAKRSTTRKIHIIHFGVPQYGLQWTTLIKRLSTRTGSPPMLRITGIDHDHQPGHNFLENCCKRFNVPFEYNYVTKKWETIQLDDLKIDHGNEVIVVNCLYRLRHVVDEEEDLSSPRDSVLNLVNKINPDIFVHGIVNGSYNAPFFVSRFREALYYYSTMFDMVEEICEDSAAAERRMVFEENIYGKEIMNVVACEGLERVERPEGYKQWQVRNLRAGLKQVWLKQKMMKYAKAHVKLNYHKDFLVDEDKNWMLQGWKGRILFALSFWRTAKDPF